jgi:peptidoglycan/LPS O-acetylase OafA/YrhL
LNYRLDIDGLRAIAVGLVILNHAGFSFFSGGFVGVDVFFVISGFLITSIITPKIQDRTFSILWFLSRRIKRLMPVLFFIIIITTLVFSIFMLPLDLTKYYRSVIWVVLYGANFFFWREHGGYFDGGSQEAPLLHTWSLAVEEQYYLFWPLLLIAMNRILGINKTVWATIFLCVVLTIFSQWGTEVTIGAAYYLLPTRFFELLVGSLLAIVWHKLPVADKLTVNLLSIIGFVLIIGSALLLTEHHSFPGYNALYPVIGTALLIYSKNGVINNIFTHKSLVYTGKISYSLYLWHWPIFVVMRYLAIELTLEVQLFCIVLTYFLSILSYHYIEQPFRSSKYKSFKEVAIKMYCYPTIFLAFFISFGVWQNGFTARFAEEIITQEAAINTFASDSRKLCHAALRNSDWKPNDDCVFGQIKKESQPSIFLFGDSYANHIVPFLHILAADAGFSGQDYTLDRCIPITSISWGTNQYRATRCKKRNDMALNYVKNNNFKYVAIAASWPEITTNSIIDTIIPMEIEKILQHNLHTMLNEIINVGATPILIEDLPALDGKSPKCTIKKNIYNDSLDCHLKRNSNVFFNKLAASAQEKFVDLIVIRPQETMCQGDVCEMEINDVPLFRDEYHLNIIGAEKMAELYIEKFDNPLKG